MLFNFLATTTTSIPEDVKQEIIDKILANRPTNFFKAITDFFSGIWAFVSGLAESVVSLFDLLVDSVGLLGGIFIFIPGFIATFALSYLLIRLVKTVVGR